MPEVEEKTELILIAGISKREKNYWAVDVQELRRGPIALDVSPEMDVAIVARADLESRQD